MLLTAKSNAFFKYFIYFDSFQWCVLQLFSLLLHQDVSHGFDELVTIIMSVLCHVSTCVRVIGLCACTKPDSGITDSALAVILIITKEAYSCSCMSTSGRQNIETLLVTVVMQGCLGIKQPFPRDTIKTFLVISERGSVRVKCFALKHNAVSQVSVQSDTPIKFTIAFLFIVPN